MKYTYGASAQAQLFGIPTIRNDDINPGTLPVVGFNVDEGVVPPPVGSVSANVQQNVDLSAAVDSMVEQANSLGKVAAELIDRATRGDAKLKPKYKVGQTVHNTEEGHEGKIVDVDMKNGQIVYIYKVGNDPINLWAYESDLR